MLESGVASSREGLRTRFVRTGGRQTARTRFLDLSSSAFLAPRPPIPYPEAQTNTAISQRFVQAARQYREQSTAVDRQGHL